ncbi:Ketosteroid isomerase-related protein [Cedecea lapagei]|uniref:Ketosteroid isomerase-related protein n=1 Tax=Cedecea lapagei TaxID=158823 RepID=A0A447V586_9ENTR|nr:nuclear transport factor 2 family protein [Cedecea lapagei]VEB99713.1 Ketosteroid isomerase-related protein [Cedecea lapagei]
MSEKNQAIQKALTTGLPKDVVYAFLLNTDKDSVANAANLLVDEHATYTSLNFENPELKQIEPWAGTTKGRQVYIDTFSNVGTYWHVDNFAISDLFAEQDVVAVFGQFTYTSVALNQTFTSPFAIKARVENGKIVYFQFMEDTYASAASFRASGKWVIRHHAGEGNTFTVGKE